MLRRIREDENFSRKILFTDEASFTTAGMFNRKNKHFWARVNPHKKQIVKIQGRKSINVWCGIIDNRVLGPIIIQNTLNGPRYLDLLSNEVEEALEELPIQIFNNIIWQQDGAPPHNTVGVTEYLNDSYDLWIGRRGPINWPANSPDLSPLDFFLWGYLKNKVYYNRPTTIRELAEKIEIEINNLNDNNPQFIINAVNQKFTEQLHKCVRNEGGWID